MSNHSARFLAAALAAFAAAFTARAEQFVNGVMAEYFSFAGQTLSAMPDLGGLTPDLARVEADIFRDSTNDPWEGLGAGFRDSFASRHTALLNIPADGEYTFSLESDDGSALWIDGGLVADNGGLHSMRAVQGAAQLSAGTHALRVEFFEKSGGAGLKLSWSGPGFSLRPVPPEAFLLPVPDGLAHGLGAELFDLSPRAGVLSALPDLRGRDPDLTNAVSCVWFPSSAAAWAGFPASATNHFALRLTGWVLAPENGDYTFYLESDDGSRLFIDNAPLIDNDGDHSLRERQASAGLGAGLHRIRVEYLEIAGDAGLTLRWSGPGIPKSAVPASALFRDTAPRDADGDGMTDAWELSNGLDPDDASDASADPDGDGLGNLAECLAGSDPNRFDPDPAATERGLWAELFTFPGEDLQTLPDLAGLASALTVPVTNVWHTLGSDALPDGEPFAARVTGYLSVPSGGVYRFQLRSDDGSRLCLDGSPVIDNDGAHSARDREASVWLDAGCHPILISYFDCGGEKELKLAWSVPGSEDTVPVPPSAFLRPKAAPGPPSVHLLSPGSEGDYGLGDAVPLIAAAYDGDGSVARVAFLANGVPLGDGTPGGGFWALSWRNVSVTGAVEFVAVAYDNAGNASVSNARRLTVEPPPPGYAFGAGASFFAFSGALSALPDLGGLTPSLTLAADAVNYPASVDGNPWPGLPSSMVNRYAARFSGFLWVRESGAYTLTLRSDDGAALRVGGEAVIGPTGPHSMRSHSADLYLAAGAHPFEIDYFENTGYAGLVLSWARAGGVSRPVPPSAFLRLTGDPDGDGDGMPDWWETSNGLDPADPSDASADPDGDGLGNLAEYMAGTDPNRPDSDGDGMPDGWEVSKATLPFIADATADPDGDGLCNLAEHLAGTDPAAADSDGDGCPDGLEVLSVRSDPLAADIGWGVPPETDPPVAGASFAASTGTWRTDSDGTAYAVERAGSLTWRLSVPDGGADALAVRVSQREPLSATDAFDLTLWADGAFAGRQTVAAPYADPEEAYFFLPPGIAPGTHDFRLVWRNWEANTFLAVHSLRFVSFGGPDADGNGVADWIDHRDAAVTALGTLPVSSVVSPLCVEGCDIWRDVLEIAAAYPGTGAVFAVTATVGDGFYADIPLSPDGPTVVSLAGRALTNAFPVVWAEFDAFSGAHSGTPLEVRAGSSLRVGGFGAAETSVTVSRASGEGWETVTNWAQTVAAPYRFDAPGLHLVSVSAPDGLFGTTNAHALVDVISSRFPKRNPAVLRDASVTLECPGLSPRCLIEHDPELAVAAEPSGSGVALALATSADRDLGLVSRLGEDGPIADAVRVTPVWSDNGGYFRVAESYPDGSQLVEVSLLIGAFPEGTEVELEIFVSGVTFEDGTRVKTLTAADFDADGHATVRFIRARGVSTSVCHRTRIRQNGALIYTNEND